MHCKLARPPNRNSPKHSRHRYYQQCTGSPAHLSRRRTSEAAEAAAAAAECSRQSLAGGVAVAVEVEAEAEAVAAAHKCSHRGMRSTSLHLLPSPAGPPPPPSWIE